MKRSSSFIYLIVCLTFGLFQVINLSCSTSVPDEETSRSGITESPPSESLSQLQTLEVCSFNIQFLGLSRSRHDKALAEI